MYKEAISYFQIGKATFKSTANKSLIQSPKIIAILNS